MDLYKAIKELYQQKQHLDRVIAALEELQRTGGTLDLSGKRRGRAATGAAARREVSRRLRRYWAMRCNAQKQPKRPRETETSSSLTPEEP